MRAGMIDAARSNLRDVDLLARQSALSRQLRKRRLRLERVADPLTGAPSRPDLYFDHAPSGRYPIVALRTVPCDSYVGGHCTPCSYSARAYAAGLAREDLYRGIEHQVEWMLDRFDELFTTKANGRLDGWNLRAAPDRPWYMLQLAGESSFFRDAEVPPAQRRWVLERLCAFQSERGVNLHLMLESRPEHLLAAEERGELAELAPLMAALDVVVNVGLEWRDDFLRNVVFGKQLELGVFIRAMQAARRRRLDPGAFLFAGSSILTTGELLVQIDRSLRFTESLGLFANLMVPNLQTHTLPHLLYQAGRYDLPEPYFLLDVADGLLSYRPRRPHPVTPFDWFLGGLESDPAPDMTLLDHPRRRTGEATTSAIHACLLDLVRTMDVQRYRSEAACLRAEPDYQIHLRDLGRTDARTWRERLAAELEFLSDYLHDSDVKLGADLTPAA